MERERKRKKLRTLVGSWKKYTAFESCLVCLITINQIYHWRWFKSHSSQAVQIGWRLSRDSFAIQIGSHVAEQDIFTYRTLYQWTVNKTTWNKAGNKELFYYSVWVFENPTSGRVFIMNERVQQSTGEYLPEYLQRNETATLVVNQVKYFAEAISAFTIFLHWWHNKLIVYQFRTVSLFSNRNSKVAKRTPFSSSSSSSVKSPSSTTRLHSADWSN